VEPADRGRPSIARVIAGEWSKDRVRQFLRDNMKVTAERTTHHARMTSTAYVQPGKSREGRDTAAGIHGVERSRGGC